MPRPVSIINAGGRPVANTADETRGVPMTPVTAPLYGEPVTLYDGGAPVVLVNDDLSLWENSAAVMLEGRADGVAFDFKQDNYAIKASGVIIETGSITGDMSADFSGTPLLNANGMHFDGSFFHTGFDLSRVTGWVDTKFTWYCHIHNSDDSTVWRVALRLSDEALDIHAYEFVQSGQTRSQIYGSDSGAQQYANFEPSTIVGLTETKRGVAIELNNTQIARDGTTVATDTNCTVGTNFSQLLIGCNNDATGVRPLLATMESVLVICNERDNAATLQTNTTL